MQCILPECSINILGVGDVDAGSNLCSVILPQGIIDILSVGDMVYEAFTL